VPVFGSKGQRSGLCREVGEYIELGGRPHIMSALGGHLCLFFLVIITITGIYSSCLTSLIINVAQGLAKCSKIFPNRQPLEVAEYVFTVQTPNKQHQCISVSSPPPPAADCYFQKSHHLPANDSRTRPDQSVTF